MKKLLLIAVLAIGTQSCQKQIIAPRYVEQEKGFKYFIGIEEKKDMIVYRNGEQVRERQFEVLDNDHYKIVRPITTAEGAVNVTFWTDPCASFSADALVESHTSYDDGKGNTITVVQIGDSLYRGQ